jgi:hypothetical protein
MEVIAYLKPNSVRKVIDAWFTRQGLSVSSMPGNIFEGQETTVLINGTPAQFEFAFKVKLTPTPSDARLEVPPALRDHIRELEIPKPPVF